MNILYFTPIFAFLQLVIGNSELEEVQGSGRHQIEGKVTVPFTNDQDWVAATRILVDGGEYLGFLKYVEAFIDNILSFICYYYMLHVLKSICTIHYLFCKLIWCFLFRIKMSDNTLIIPIYYCVERDTASPLHLGLKGVQVS